MLLHARMYYLTTRKIVPYTRYGKFCKFGLFARMKHNSDQILQCKETKISIFYHAASASAYIE